MNTDTGNMDEAEKRYAERKKTEKKKKARAICLHLYEVLEKRKLI